ncbi:efflux RND transporter permease subunit, partial [Pseudophaeobacter arcticus]|uniref:efflux RND transporter permease subunit n=1 Tax=Pseudophaeobacter arcticus TaxID=385492 RepID=UPI00248F5F74
MRIIGYALQAFLDAERAQAPPGITLEITADGVSVVRDRLTLVVVNGLQGLALVFGVLWLFFGFRFSFWVAMGLPVSFMGGVALMGLVGYSLNLMTTLGLLIVIGLLMDDAIVIAENIARLSSTPDASKVVEAAKKAAAHDMIVELPDGRIIRIADLVDDAAKRDKVINSLKDPATNDHRDFVDIIVALGMAKEGFDWIWCEHALTIGYRNSLTEIIQIIGRATRDAPGKESTRFTNLIAEPDASEDAVVDAVNDTLKAIAASLLMEQVLAPRMNFTPKNAG